MGTPLFRAEVAGLRAAAAPAAAVRHLPVPEALATLLPGGIPAGTVAEVADRLVMLALAGAAATTTWAAVGMPDLGILAARDMGLDPDAGLLVDEPGEAWSQVVSLLLDSVGAVLLGDVGPVADQLARRLTARARRGGALLLAEGRWPGAALRLRVAAAEWHGLDHGHGVLVGRRATVVASGRGMQPRHAEVWLPDRHGRVAAADADDMALISEMEALLRGA